MKNDFVACFIRDDYGLRSAPRDVRTILDIGANVGFVSLAARARYPHALIHAYEPNPRAVRHLTTNTEFLNIRVYPEALGASMSRVSVIDASSINLATTRPCEEGTVTQASFETAIERLGGTVDLLKMDCEGCEWELFKCPECWQRVKTLRMEYHLTQGRTLEALQETLAALGLQTTKLECSEGFGLIWAERRSASQLFKVNVPVYPLAFRDDGRRTDHRARA